MADANLRIQKIDELRAHARKIENEIREERTQLLDDIQKGVTTGDRIKDFVILICGLGHNNEEFEAICYPAFRDLDSQISQHVGELVLIIQKKEVIDGCAGICPESRDEDYVLRTDLYFGIIKRSGLVFNLRDGSWQFPTVNYVSCLNVERDREINLEYGNLSIWGGFYPLPLFLGKPLERKNPRARFQETFDLKCEIVIGDSEVLSRYYDLVDPVLRLLK